MPGASDTITYRAMLAECNRELAMRTRLYPQWVDAKRMTQATADRQLAVMVAMVAHFTPLAEAEKQEAESAEPRFEL